VEFERDRANHTITMSQRKYIEEVLYWKKLENKQEMKASRFMKWNNYIN
jgi:hypothetical protein